MSICETVRYLEAGRGEQPVILLHGLFGRPENWHSIIERLADDYRFYAVQFPINPDPSRRYNDFCTVEQLTDFVEVFFAETGLERAALCGNSLGGQIAIEFALRHPHAVSHLVLTGSAGLFERSVNSGGKLRATREKVRERAAEVFYDPRHVTEAMVDELYEMVTDRAYARYLVRVAKATRDRSVKEHLDRLNVPTLIIWGKNDCVTPPFVAEEFRQHISGAELAFLDECGHSPPIEQPEQFSRIMHDFLCRNGRRPYRPGKPR